MHNFTAGKQLLLMLGIATLSACGGSSPSTPPESGQIPDPTIQNPTDQNPENGGDNGSGENVSGENGGGDNSGEDNNGGGDQQEQPGGQPEQPEEQPGGGDGDEQPGGDNSNPVVQPQNFPRLPSGGHLSNPEFQWTAVAGASSYRLIILDDRNDRVSEQFTAQQAGCLDTTVACKFTPSIQIHDSILKWRVQSFDATGEWIETSDDVAYNTLRSLSAQPYTSLDNIGAPPNPGHGFPTIEFDQFVALNNAWGAQALQSDAWSQTVSVDRLQSGDALVTFEYDFLSQSDGDEYAVKSYPQVVYGNKLGAHVSGTREELGVPEKINNLDEFKIDYRYTETGSAERNLAFESFFHTDCDIGGPNFEVDDREYEMMVWIANPTIRTPGSTKAETGVMIDNQLWDVWIKPNQDKDYIAFTAVNEVTQGSLNWNRFVDWTVNWSAANNPTYGITVLDTNWCMAGIEFGVETWWGAAKLQLDELTITRQ